MQRRLMIAGNWKMHGLGADLDFFADLTSSAARDDLDIVICPPATILAQAAWKCRETAIQLGGQDCHAATSGAHTGDISAAMLLDAGARYVILGHSERRMDHGETSALVHAKAEAASKAGLVAIICVGETGEERAAGKTLEVVRRQIADSVPAEGALQSVIAYEPVWAIGTGLTPEPADVAEVHAYIRSLLPHPAKARILYGGSVKPDNAAEFLGLDDVDGALVGGASLDAASFSAIIAAAPR
jgi:triosephosphate isomerase